MSQPDFEKFHQRTRRVRVSPAVQTADWEQRIKALRERHVDRVVAQPAVAMNWETTVSKPRARRAAIGTRRPGQA